MYHRAEWSEVTFPNIFITEENIENFSINPITSDFSALRYRILKCKIFVLKYLIKFSYMG